MAIDNSIPLSDLPKVSSGPFDSLVGVDEATGAARRFPMPIVDGMKGYATKAALDADTSQDAGTLALVTNDPTPANNGTWRWTGSAWVLSADRVTGLEAQLAGFQIDLTEIASAFDIIPPKNLYNPALAEDGFVYDYNTGVKGAFANGIVSGKIPVTEGVTYTISQPSPERGLYRKIFCWSGATYLGLSESEGGSSPVMPGLNVSQGDASGVGGYRRVTFTIPVGSGITHVGFFLAFAHSAHTTADFNRIRTSTQLEVGTVATALVPYTPYGTPVLDPDAIPVTPVDEAFDIVPSRNLYNKANALNGHILSYATGLNAAYADGISLGYFPVEAGKTYTVSMRDPLGFHSTKPIYCRNAAGAFLGIDHTIGGTPGMANPPTNVTWVGTSQVTFTIPVGSAIAFVGFMAEYSVHTTADFERVIGTVQAEEGTVATDYQRYSADGIAVLRPDALTGMASNVPLLPVGVTKSGDDLYIRTSFDATSDLIQRVSLAGAAFTNNTVNVMGARKVAKTATGAVGGYTGGTILAAQGDSSAPLNYNGTFMGANHGAFFVKEVTAAAHGKVVQDVGSEWTDGAGVKWYLMRVVDANRLWFMPQNNAVYPAWSFTTILTGNLVHSSGATNTGTVTVTSSAQAQLFPALQNQIKRVLLDGLTEITEDGDYRCNFVDVVNGYDIANPAAAVTYVRSQVGSATQPSFIHPSIAADIRRSLTYRYSENGSCTIVDGVQVIGPIAWSGGYFPGTQAEPLTFAGKQLWEYIPRVTPKVGSVKTWDFAAQENISSTFEQINMTAANWADPNNPPDRMAQIVKTAGVAEFGMMLGLSPVRSVGLPATRKTLVNDALMISAIRKQYMKAVNIGAITPGSYYETVAFRAFWSASDAPAATCFTWYRDGRHVIVVADFHQNVSLSPLKLPAWMVGMDVAVVDKTASATVHGNGIVAANGVLVSVTGGYGYVVLKLS